MTDTTYEQLARAEGRHHDQMDPGKVLADKLAEHEKLRCALEWSLADMFGQVAAAGVNMGVSRPSHNVLTLTSRRGDTEVQLQVIVRAGTAHEVRDDLWDAIMDRQDMDTSMTDLANAAMERLGFPAPDGGWPK